MLSIGDICLDSPAVQAALSGYSDLPMRRVARAHGAPFAFHEVVLGESVVQKGKLQRRILDVRPDDHPVGGQLMGAVPKTFGEAAGLLTEVGYDVVDINFGCPVSRALGRCRGGYLLGEPETALEIVDRVLEACAGRVPVTVKMRRGRRDDADSVRSFYRILDGAFERGIAAVTVHGRTVEQGYDGPSRWEFLAEVKRHLGERTMLGSGDLFTPESVLAMLRETGVDGVTIARGCIGNPWIFQQVRDLLAGRPVRSPRVEEQGRALEMHRDEAVAHYGAERAVSKTRTHAIQYAAIHPDKVTVRNAFARMRRFDEFDAILDAHYRDLRVRVQSAASVSMS